MMDIKEISKLLMSTESWKAIEKEMRSEAGFVLNVSAANLREIGMDVEGNDDQEIRIRARGGMAFIEIVDESFEEIGEA